MDILKDIKTSVDVFYKIRKARKEGAPGAAVTVKPVRKIPVYHTSYWGATMEFCPFCGTTLNGPVASVFKAFPEALQHEMTFTPKEAGGWVSRARMWQSALKPELTELQYYLAMAKILKHFRKCVTMRAMGGS